MGVIGVVATSVMAVRATPKAIELVETDSRDNHNGDSFAYTKFEAVRSCWRCYIPAATVGIATISCILGAGAINKRRQSAITGAYILLDNAYKEYKSKAKELFGEDADIQIRNAIAKNKYNKNDISVSEEKLLFYEEICGEYFERSKEEVLNAEYHFNRNFALRGYACLNELYEFLGLPKTETGDILGWSLDAGFGFYGYSWVDFEHQIVVMDDGLECLVITMPFSPTADYLGDF
jgi:hypothetical protein